MSERLFTPGPTTIPESILQAMHVGALHHRSSRFKEILTASLSGMTWLLNERPEPIPFACSGTGAMEAALLNTTQVGDTIVTVNAGVFGSRWRVIGERLGLEVIELAVDWGRSAETQQCLDLLASNPDAKAFCIQQVETSTTVSHKLEEILPAVKQRYPQILTVVDGISSFMTEPLPTLGRDIDIYLIGSQKALMLPPGLAFLSLNSTAWRSVEETPRRTLYFDLLTERKALQKCETAWTPATHIFLGLNAALEIFRSEGLENIFARHSAAAKIIRDGIIDLGLELLAPHNPANGVSGFFPRAGTEAEQIRKVLRERFQIRTAGGQGKWKERVIRVGHMGAITEQDARGFIADLSEVV